MGKTGSFHAADLKKLQAKLDRLKKQEADAFVEACAKELAARLLAKVIKRTPVGDYSVEVQVTAKRDSKYHKKGDVYTKRVTPSGKMGGTLRRGWTSKTQEEAEAGKGTPSSETVRAFVDSLAVERTGGMVRIEIVNPVLYAAYVEYGHRQEPGRYVPAIGKRLKRGWVPGQFMLTISEQEIRTIAPKVLEAKLKMFLKEHVG